MNYQLAQVHTLLSNQVEYVHSQANVLTYADETVYYGCIC